jgi:hypothetical protein
MHDSDAPIDQLAYASSKPDLSTLTAELRRSTDEGAGANRTRRAENTRFCRWAGQADDGRKHQQNMPEGKQAFPWDGAADTRVSLVDHVTNGLVDMLTTGFWRSTLKVNGTGHEDAANAAVYQKVMDWLVNTKLQHELTREVELGAQIAWTYGWTAYHITWQQETQLQYERLNTMQIAQAAQSAAPDSLLAQLPALILDPAMEEPLAELLGQQYVALKPAAARRAVRELRENGETKFPVPRIIRNQPCVAALVPFEELCIPPETITLQKARVIFRRCYLSEAELRAMAVDAGWDADFIEAAAQSAGKLSLTEEPLAVLQSLTNNNLDRRDKLIEIVYAYTRQLDDNDVPGIYCTVFNPQVPDVFAKHELLDYAHGKYPFVEYRTEVLHRKLTESRGVPDIAQTWQGEIKAQRDGILDYTSLNTLPPILVPKTRGGNLKLGPAVQVPVLRPGEISYMDPPKRDPNVAFNVIQHIEDSADDYFGRVVKEQWNTPRALLRQQRLMNNWLHTWTEVFDQLFALTLQYMPEEQIRRVTNHQGPLPQSPEYDFILRFDVREMQEDFALKKLEAISKFVLPEDAAGVVDRAKLITLKLRAIDPTLAEEVVMDKAGASQQMFKGVQADIALMQAGHTPELVENDATAPTKLQFAQSILQGNPKVQQQLQGDQLFQQLFKQYVDNLQFSATQEQNKVIGRLGVAPAPTQQIG